MFETNCDMRLVVRKMPENVKDCQYYSTEKIYDEREDAWIGTREYCFFKNINSHNIPIPCNKDPKLCPHFCDLKDDKIMKNNSYSDSNTPTDDEMIAMAKQDRSIQREELGIQTPRTKDGLVKLRHV